jgi:hypothetical protein
MGTERRMPPTPTSAEPPCPSSTRSSARSTSTSRPPKAENTLVAYRSSGQRSAPEAGRPGSAASSDRSSRARGQRRTADRALVRRKASFWIPWMPESAVIGARDVQAEVELVQRARFASLPAVTATVRHRDRERGARAARWKAGAWNRGTELGGWDWRSKFL